MTGWGAAFASPQVAQALVAGAFLALGWVLTHGLSLRRDRALRGERIADVQRALLAEIRAHVAVLERMEAAGTLAPPDPEAEAEPLPILPHDANDRIFRAIVEEVHILPEWAIDPVVRYYRLLAVRAALAQDIRQAVRDHPDRAAAMIADYAAMTRDTLAIGTRAVEILTASLRGGAAAVAALRRPSGAVPAAGAVNSTDADPRSR